MSPDRTPQAATPPPPTDAAGKPALRGIQWLFAYWLAWVVLGISLAATGGGWFVARKHEEMTAVKRFDADASRIQTALSERLLIYLDVLHGGAGLFAASKSVERSEWKAYVDAVSVNERFPGIDGLGFLAHVPRQELETFLRETRADKTPDFGLKNPGSYDDLLVVKYLEPEQAHTGQIGTDAGTDGEWRAAAEMARDTAAAVVTGPVLMQGRGQELQSGFLMLLPVYRNGMSALSLAERRDAISGWVFGRFITTELMRGILDDKAASLSFRVSDQDRTGERLIFDSNSLVREGAADYQSRYTSTSSLAVGQRRWSLQFTATRAFETTISRSLEWLAVLGGLLISLLLFGITLSLSSTRARAMRMATEKTAAFREANEQLQKEIKEREYMERRTAIHHSVTNVLAEAETVAEAAPQILRALCESLGWNFGALWRIDPMLNQLHCVEVWHRPGMDVAGFEAATRSRTFRLDEGLPGRVWATKRPAWIKDVTRDKNFPRAPFAAKAKLHAAFGFPLLLTNDFLGMMEFFSHEIIEPDQDLLQLVAALGSQIGQFIERKQAREELEHEQFLLRTLMDNLPDRIYFKDAQSRFLRNSRAHLKWFGLADQRDALGKSDFDFFAEEHARQAYEDEQKLMQADNTLTVEEKETWPDGSVTWALSTKMALHDQQDKIVGTFGISRDITDRKRAEEAMRTAKEAAEEANRTKSQFLANMSHELRTPLNSVIGFAGILLKNKSGNISPTELNFLDRIQANGKQLLQLINEILDLSKIEARKIELQVEPVDLGVLVRETIAQQEGLVRDRPVRLIADVPPSVALIQADADKLRQVIINLIGNALKFTERGSVTVRVVADPKEQQPQQIDVVDTGIGIPKEKLGAIFEAFQQADASTARKYGGTGLGLTISQALCQLMGFHIKVASEVGKGSTFSIVLRRKEVAAVTPASGVAPAIHPAAAASETRAASELHGKLVLVIDDESDSRVLLTHMLEEFGCQVIAANTGEQGLQMAREFHPSVITTDLLMPNMDGATVIRTIKADPQLREIPMVVVSIVAEERRGSILGTVDVLEKPVSRQALHEAISHFHLPPNARLLIVDDEADAREIICSHLADRPFRINTATNGREALDKMQAVPPDLVVLDLLMPVMDGIAFLDTIRSDPRYQMLPVLIVTSKVLSPLEKEQLRQQKLAFVRKPEIAENHFKDLLQQILRQTESRRTKPSPPDKPKAR